MCSLGLRFVPRLALHVMTLVALNITSSKRWLSSVPVN